MRRLLTLTLLLAVAVAASATDLAKRFADGDRTLTPAEISTVYYSSPGRQGFNANPDYDRINALRAERAYEKLLVECQALLSQDPTQLHPLFLLYAAASQLGQQDVKDKAQWQVASLCDAVFASGKGVLEESPYRVVRSADILPFLRNYLYVKDVLGSSQKGSLTAALVNWDDNEIYFFFDVNDGR